MKPSGTLLLKVLHIQAIVQDVHLDIAENFLILILLDTIIVSIYVNHIERVNWAPIESEQSIIVGE